MSLPAVAFIARNVFQFLHIELLWRAYPGSTVLLVGKAVDWESFKATREPQEQDRFIVASYKQAAQISSAFDVIFFQTPFPFIDEISSRLVCVQYGLAKERHNYGEWHALADLNLMYGRYSCEAVNHFSPSVAVGNLKFAGWNPSVEAARKPILSKQYGLDESLPTLLYMPTYQELGSFSKLKQPLSRLIGQYNIIIKAHHNQEANGDLSWRDAAKVEGFTHLYGANCDQRELLAVADVVVSDFSGAIFDALYAGIPVVLFQEGASDVVGIQKFSLDSLEYRRRNELGTVCDDAREIAQAVNRALKSPEAEKSRLALLKAELIVDGTEIDAVEQAQSAARDLLEGRVPKLTTPQMYVRELVKSSLKSQREFAKSQRDLAKAQQALTSVRHQPRKRSPKWRRLLGLWKSRLGSSKRAM